MGSADKGLLRICFLGNLEVRFDSVLLPKFPTRKSTALFAKLVLNAGHIFQRDVLGNLFWGSVSTDKAKKCLRTELWRIRSILDHVGVDPDSFFLVGKHSIGFKSDSLYELDVNAFECNLVRLLKIVPEELSVSDFRKLLDSVEMYKGYLLENVYEDWFVAQREVLHSQYMMALEHLMKYYKHNNNLDTAINFGQKLLCHDPLLEHIHLELIRCQYMKGNRPGAIKQYIKCRDILSEELGVSPMMETESVYRSILVNQ